jgi:putative transposase
LAGNYSAVDTRAHAIGAKTLLPQAGLAEMRGTVERLFHTLQTRIVARFSGQTFANIIKKGDYDSEANAVINGEELNRVFIRGVLDIYHNSPHEGLGGETPLNCWMRLSREYGVRPPPCPDVHRHVFGIPHKARIGAEGVRFAGIRYQSRELQRLRRSARQKPVEIRVNRFDLPTISVRGDRGWLTVFARYPGLKNVSYVEWREAVSDLRKKHADAAKLARPIVLQAIREVNALAEMAIKRAELGSPILTPEQFEKDERSIFRNFSLGDESNDGDEEALDEVLDAEIETEVAAAADAATNDLAADCESGNRNGLGDDDSFGDETDWDAE